MGDVAAQPHVAAPGAPRPFAAVNPSHLAELVATRRAAAPQSPLSWCPLLGGFWSACPAVEPRRVTVQRCSPPAAPPRPGRLPSRVPGRCLGSGADDVHQQVLWQRERASSRRRVGAPADRRARTCTSRGPVDTVKGDGGAVADAGPLWARTVAGTVPAAALFECTGPPLRGADRRWSSGCRGLRVGLGRRPGASAPYVVPVQARSRRAPRDDHRDGRTATMMFAKTRRRCWSVVDGSGAGGAGARPAGRGGEEGGLPPGGGATGRWPPSMPRPPPWRAPVRPPCRAATARQGKCRAAEVAGARMPPGPGPSPIARITKSSTSAGTIFRQRRWSRCGVRPSRPRPRESARNGRLATEALVGDGLRASRRRSPRWSRGRNACSGDR